MIIEIDNMSKYNAKHGRVAGDKVIRLISQSISDTLKRPGDLLARYGGETFAVLMPNTKDGAPIAQQCMAAVSELKLPFDKEEGQEIMTVSIGGVTILDVSHLEELKVVSYAELALGKAVMQGRNEYQWMYVPEINQLQTELMGNACQQQLLAKLAGDQFTQSRSANVSTCSLFCRVSCCLVSVTSLQLPRTLVITPSTSIAGSGQAIMVVAMFSMRNSLPFSSA